TILKTAKAVSATLGTDYANSLVTSLANLLNAYSVCIALRSKTDPTVITSVARYCEGALCPSVDYPLEGSPFSTVLQDRFYVCPSNLEDRFPTYELFKRERMESYIGVALLASDGSVLGMLHASWRQPIPNVNLVISVFQFFALRAGTEMERKLLQEHSLRQARLMEQSEQMGRIGGWEFNRLTDALYWTDETYRLHETSPQEYTPTIETALCFYAPESISLITEAVHLALTQGKPYDIELQIITAKGRRVWVHTQGRVQIDGGMVTRIYGTFQDITEQKRTEQAITSSQANLQTVLESLNDIILSVDKDYNLTTINTQAVQSIQNVFGVAPKPGDSLIKVTSAEHIAFWQRDYDLAFEGETFSVTRTTEVNGQPLTAEVHFNPIIMHGNVTGVVIRANDITERVRQQEEFVQSKKLEALGHLSGGIAHDFNNFLLVIMGYTELLKSHVETIPSAAKYIEQILRASGEANTLTTQLLSFARQQHITPQVLDLNQHLQLNTGSLIHLIGEHIEMVTEWVTSSVIVKMDASQINQLMMNLVINARDAMPNGGKLTISTHKAFSQALQTDVPSNLAPGEYCLLQVTDTGIGMSPETMARIFEPLFTTKAASKGTGFGLAICYGIVKQAGGTIHAESELGRGTTFSIYLPSCNEPISSVEPADANTRALKGDATILLVEDDVAVRDITASILLSRGYEVIIAQSPKDALAIARDNDTIDLLLTDVVMPQMNGQQVSEAVKALRPSIKVLFMSGYARDVFFSQGIQLESINLIQKPFTSNRLAQSIRETLDSPA
ncbi:MAG: ATP-binding protein, partial [Armatimonadetes bacterium]|nr:ATP-binding protein [Armatimonadota bacterium]